MANTAFFIYGINSLKGGGGAERFFSDFFDKYQKTPERKFKLYFFTDSLSVKNLNEVGKLNSKKYVVTFRVFSNRFKLFLETFQLYAFILLYRIRIIHLPLYNLSYIPLLKKIDKLPSIIRPKIAINIVNCYLAATLQDKKSPYHISLKNTYEPLFSQIKAEGYFCWNKSFEDYSQSYSIFSHLPTTIQSITSRFSDVDKFFPQEKRKWVVFASRLDEQKHPEWFITALISLNKQFPNLVKEWKFFICGDGPLRSDLIKASKDNGIDYSVEFVVEGRMETILNFSKIYVSCQDFDNFPSLTMTEAMASGNAIIARNVGQTELFVKKNENGLFIEPDNAEGLTKALLQLLKDELTIERMGKASEELILNVHNYPNFVSQIESFWQSINR